jgi:hypothetical protein
MPNKQPSKKFIHLLLLFCVLYPIWVVLVEFGMQEVYFKPLCKNYADQNASYLLDYNRGGRSNPASCVVTGATRETKYIPITEIGGQTAQVIYIGTDIVAVLLPFLGIFFLKKQKKLT